MFTHHGSQLETGLRRTSPFYQAAARFWRLYSQTPTHPPNQTKKPRRSRDRILDMVIPPDLSKPTDPSNKSVFAFERLSEAYKLLSSPQTFKYTVSKCYNYYESKNSIFSQDLMKYPRINQDLAKLLFMSYNQSKSIRIFLINDFASLLINNQNDELLEMLYLLKETVGDSTLSPQIVSQINYMWESEMHIEELRQRLAFVVLVQSCLSGEHLLASALAIRLYKAGIEFDHKIVNILFRALSVDTTLHITYNSVTILKLLDTFGYTTCDTQTLLKLVDYMMREQGAPFFANFLYEKILSTCDVEQDNIKVLSDVTRRLIRRNLEVGNADKAYSLWCKIHSMDTNFPSESIDLIPQMLESLMKSNKQQQIDELILSLPENILLQQQDIVEKLIRYYGIIKQDRAEFDLYLKRLQPPLKRSTLSVLLESFLLQNNEVAHDKILPSILNSKNGINHNDFAAIITKLLRQHKLQESINMATTTDVQIAKTALVNIFKYVLFHDEVGHEVRTGYIKTLVSSFRVLDKSDNALRDMTKVVLEYISVKINNRLCRKLYVNHAYRGTFSEPSIKSFDFSPMYIPQQMEKLILIDDENRFDCLFILGERALKDRDIAMLKWTMNEMRVAGMLLKDIVKHFFHLDAEYLSSILQGDLIKQIE